ncbi:redoxin domain-containing protein [Calycomorphotria hydatis]|uniref:Thiol-disulfide oxidoreductase ResA n=1 Tax=Calycomorphotria hydatis TaxID=2528027 RepID=A0A517T816_9PLAN|nr:redoxin domain-containing protein [Calycomorphotria hydatis]QDT64525.1 Thiol-disulfide oxidoreductase ResA [Calycomorphotria hydatis]
MIRLQFAVFGLLSLILCGSDASIATAAESPSAELALSFRPTQPSVDYEMPARSDFEKCAVQVERTDKHSGWVVLGPQGQVIRRFIDSNGDNVVDQWRYYNQGLEVFRDVDSNFNSKVDQFRWLNMGGTRWGLDTNEDGKVDQWKILSAEEASRVAVEAMIRGDINTLQTVLITPQDVKSLGVNEQLSQDLLRSVSQPEQKVKAELSNSSIVNTGTKWMKFDSAAPGTIPADEGKAKGDITVYENAMAIVETGGKPGLVQVGELVRIGDVWKLTQIPKPMGSEAVQVMAGGILMQPQAPELAGTIAPEGISPQMQQLLKQLQELDSNSPGPADQPQAFGEYNMKRADILTKLAQNSPDAQQRDQWTAQVADSLSAALQTGNYPNGLARLRSLEQSVKQSSPNSPLVPYVVYRRMLSEYALKLIGADSETREEVQKWWLQQLEEFASAYPKAEDVAEALLQLGISQEFGGDTARANTYYSRLASTFPQSTPGRRAAGAVKRLSLKGQVLDFGGNKLGGGKISTQDYRGKALLVVYWATWCKPCAEDLPQLKEIYAAFRGKGFEIIGVNLDENPAIVTPHIQQNGMNWPHIHEPGGLDGRPALELGVVSLPTMVLLGKDGRVISRNISVEDLRTALPKVLAQ